MPRAVWIVRHGDRLDFTDPTWERTAARPYDPPLAPTGIAQAHALARQLGGARIAHLFASPFLRTVETAHPVALALGLRIKIEPGLSEWLSAAWFPQPPRLLSLDELAQRFPSIDRTYTARGGARYGESGEEALARSGATARRLVTDFDGDLLIVGHGASVLGGTAGLLEVDASTLRPALGDMPSACIVKLVRHSETWVIDSVTDPGHLGGTGVPRTWS
jgi:broad specificity phosphatase PhoE